MAALPVIAVTGAQAADIGTGFTYQGSLKASGIPVNDTCDFRFGLWDAATSGTQMGNSPQTVSFVGVENGLFAAPVDFGAAAFNGTARWLQVEVRCPAGGGGFTAVGPRVGLSPAPHALALPGLFTQQNSFSPNVIGGIPVNAVTPGAAGATIAGGGAPVPDNNRVTDTFGAIGGGCTNRAGNNSGTPDDAQFATIAGGFRNIAGAYYTTVGGGVANAASAQYSTVPGGDSNEAGGAYSFAAGRRGKVRTPAQVGGGDTNGDEGTFLWADSTNADFLSTGPNRFLVRASGGATIYSDILLSAGVTLPPGDSAWTMASDRGLKDNFATVNVREVLARLLSIPLSTWNYKSQDASIRHMGPMGQDFFAAFGLGTEATRISTIDTDGVALAAIQGLHELVQEKDCEIAELRDKNVELEARLAAVEALCARRCPWHSSE
jgi:hypothetical protein